MADGLLWISDDVALPADVVTQTLAILAMRRAGKSNTGVVLAEGMYDLGLPVVAIDPKGDWWGLRSSADGTGPGLPIPVFGGLHGDMPLNEHAGRLIAELIVDLNLSCVLDVSDFPSDEARWRFLAEFGKALFDLHRRHPQPRHLILEEADEVIPQQPQKGQAACVHIYCKMIKQGGSFGLGMTIISQRSAVVKKDGLSQIGTLIPMRTTAKLDRDAIGGWVEYHQASREVTDSLPGLADGAGWVVSPQWLAMHGHPAVQRVQFRRRRTFDSGATPTMTTTAGTPATLADVDLSRLLDRMEAVTAEAAEHDPAALRARIAGLERALEVARRGTPSGEVTRLRTHVTELTEALTAARNQPPVKVEVPALTDEDRSVLAAAIDALARVTSKLVTVAGAPAPPTSKPPVPARAKPARTEPIPSTAQLRAPEIKRGAVRMLEALARMHPMRITRAQLATVAGMKRTGGTFGSYFSALRTAGLITEERGLVSITETGFSRAGVAAAAPPVTTEEIREQWRNILKAGSRTMLDALLAAYPASMTRAELAAAAGLEETGGTFGSYLSVLRTNGLADVTGQDVRATSVFFLQEAQ